MDGNQVPMTEDPFPLPETRMAFSKYACDSNLKAAHEMFGLNYVIFRPHNVTASGRTSRSSTATSSASS